MGELHLEVLVDRLRREFGVDGEDRRAAGRLPRDDYGQGRGERALREADRRPRPVRPRGDGGSSRSSPATGFEFVNKVVSGRVPKEYIPAVEQGRGRRDAEGRLRRASRSSTSASPCSTVRTTRSTRRTSRSAPAPRVRSAGRSSQGSPQLLEPVMSVNVVTPEELAGAIMGSLCNRRGLISGWTMQGNAKVIKAMVPLADDVRLRDRRAEHEPGQGELHDALRALPGGAVRHRRGDRRRPAQEGRG